MTTDFLSQNKFFNELDEHSAVISGKIHLLLVQDIKIKGLKNGQDFFLTVESNRIPFQTELSNSGAWKEDFTFAFKGLTPNEFMKEEVRITIYDNNEVAVAWHTFKLRDLDVGKEETFKEDIIGSTFKIEYTTLVSKEEMYKHVTLKETTFYEEKSKMLHVIDKLVMCILVNRFTKIPESPNLEFVIKCNNLHQIAPVDANMRYWNKVYYIPLSGIKQLDFFDAKVEFELLDKKQIIASGSSYIKDYSYGIQNYVLLELENKSDKDIKLEMTITLETKQKWKQPKGLLLQKDDEIQELEHPEFSLSSTPEKRKSSFFDMVKGKKFSFSKLFNMERKGSALNLIERKTSLQMERVNSFSSIKDLKNNRNSIGEKTFKNLLETNRDRLKKKALYTENSLIKERGRSVKRKSLGIAELKIKELLKNNEDIEEHEKILDINERLYFLISKKKVDDFKKIIENSTFDKNWLKPIENETLLHKATKMNILPIVELLVTAGVSIDLEDRMKRTPLLIASSMGYKDIAIYLIAKGANIHKKDGYGYYPLFICLKHHQFHMIQDLILFGSDINMKRDNGSTPLHESISTGDSEMLEEILNIKGVKLNVKETNGKTPLLVGCEAAPSDIFLRFLKVKGVDINACDEMGRNIFHFLAIYKRNDIFKELLFSHDCTIYKEFLTSKEKRKNRIPMHLAVESKNFQFVKSLITLYITCKIDIFVQDSNKQTPYDLAYSIVERDFIEKLDTKEDDIFEAMHQDSLLIEDLLNSMKTKKK